MKNAEVGEKKKNNDKKTKKRQATDQFHEYTCNLILSQQSTCGQSNQLVKPIKVARSVLVLRLLRQRFTRQVHAKDASSTRSVDLDHYRPSFYLEQPCSVTRK